MSKKIIKQLIAQSYSANFMLDIKKVQRIVPLLKHSELKRYIKGLKNFEKSHTVIITVPFTPTVLEKKKFEDMFVNKKIEFVEDKSLLLGFKVQNNDLIINYNVKERLANVLEYISQ